MNGETFSNVKDIPDLYAEYKDCKKIITDMISAHGQKTECDIESIRKVCEFSRKIGLKEFPFGTIPYGNHELFVDFISKVDAEKYPQELNLLRKLEVLLYFPQTAA